MPELGVNIDHIATLRQARRTYEPDPVWAATMAELGGADGITVHLREDRRHIQDRDVRILRETITVKLNLEMACTEEMTSIAKEVRPDQVSLVPEKREEVTTEGGLDIVTHRSRVESVVGELRQNGIEVSLFIDPVDDQIRMAAELGVEAIELHTGQYALAKGRERDREWELLRHAGALAVSLNLRLHAGHGLNYQNVVPVATLPAMHELNIGHAIVARSVFVGFERAVREMKDLIS
jgi:pyridoxine 5-phosphate synthase